MSAVEFAPTDTNFPMPVFDRLGLATDAILISATETDGGQDFVAVHTRPFAGESLNYLLNNCAASRFSNTRRQHAKSTIEPLDLRRLDPRVSEDDRTFIARQARLHHQVGKFGIGATMRAFEREVRQGWQDSLDDPLTDSVYYPLFRTQVYADLSETAEWQIDEWKDLLPDDHARSASEVSGILSLVAPTEALKAIGAAYGANRHQAWQNREQNPDGLKIAYEKFSQDLRDYLDQLPQEVRVDIMGKAYSRLTHARQGSANHRLANSLIIDLAGQRHWIEMPHVYDMKLGPTDELMFPEPIVEFIDGTVQISDDNGTSVKLTIHSNGDATAPTRWSIGSYTLPPTYYENGRYPAIAWHTNRHGEREFYGQADTLRMAHEAGLPLKGTPDSYLGKLVVKYFGQEGEYQPSESEMRWMTSMGLLGSDRKRNIGIRELPVWIQLPQHQADLLNSQFIKAAEALAA